MPEGHARKKNSTMGPRFQNLQLDQLRGGGRARETRDMRREGRWAADRQGRDGNSDRIWDGCEEQDTAHSAGS